MRSASRPAPASTTRAPPRISCSVTVTDAGGLSHTETLNIGVTNAERSPDRHDGDAAARWPENAAAGTVVATLGATDPDAGLELHLYARLDPSGKFEVVGDEIRVKAGASLDHESATSHQLQRDGDRRRRPQPYRDAEHRRHQCRTKPRSTSRSSGGTVQENAAAGTVVATLGASDPDAGLELHLYAAPTPRASSRWWATRSASRPGASLDYESATSHQLSVTVTDAGGLSHTETLNIGVTNVNEAPIDITVTGGTVRRTRRPARWWRRWVPRDPDAGLELHLYARSDPSGKFEVVGDEIRVKAGASLDYESAASHQLQRDGDRRRRPQPYRDAEHRRHES